MATTEIRLTRRQAQIITCTAKGLNKAQICAVLGIKRGTLEALTYQIIEKLGTSTRQELTMLALAKGWVQNPYLGEGYVIIAEAPPDV